MSDQEQPVLDFHSIAGSIMITAVSGFAFGNIKENSIPSDLVIHCSRNFNHYTKTHSLYQNLDLYDKYKVQHYFLDILIAYALNFN